MSRIDLLNWGNTTRCACRFMADSVLPDVPCMPGMDGDGYSFLTFREKAKWVSLANRLGVSLEHALAGDWRCLEHMHGELGDEL